MTSASRKVAEALTARSAAGELFVIDLPDGMLRPAAHVFVCDQGIAFADLGWDTADAGGSTMHVLRGRPKGPPDKRLIIAMDAGGSTEIMPLDDDLRAALKLPAGRLGTGPRGLARRNLDDQATGIGP